MYLFSYVSTLYFNLINNNTIKHKYILYTYVVH